jgi:hypothetical protein
VTLLISSNIANPIGWSARTIRADDNVQKFEVDDLIWVNIRGARRCAGARLAMG